MSGVLLRSRFVAFRRVFVVVAADGHGAYGAGSDCAEAVVDRYLADALAPEGGYRCGSS